MTVAAVQRLAVPLAGLGLGAQTDTVAWAPDGAAVLRRVSRCGQSESRGPIHLNRPGLPELSSVPTGFKCQ